MPGWIETGAFTAALGLSLVFAFALFGSFAGAAIALVLVGSITVSMMAAVRLASNDSEADPDPIGTGAGTETNETDSLETLRERYARGELTESEFEHRVETLLETEDGTRRAESAVDAVGTETNDDRARSFDHH